MKTLMTVSAGAMFALIAAAPAGAELKVGDMAPAFELPGSDGKTYKSADLVGKQPIVIAWFPKAFTGG